MTEDTISFVIKKPQNFPYVWYLCKNNKIIPITPTCCLCILEMVGNRYFYEVGLMEATDDTEITKEKFEWMLANPDIVYMELVL